MSSHEKLAALAGESLAHKRALGRVYDTPEFVLKRYLLFMEAEFPGVEVPDMESTDAFLAQFSGRQGGLRNAMSTLRESSRYLARTGHGEAYVIPLKQSPKLRPEPPYFFEESEIAAFFAACDALHAAGPGPACRGLVVPAQLRLLHCCGPRRKESSLLKRVDAHLADRFIDIKDSKGHKDGRIYISGDLAGHLAGYDALVEERLPGRVYFFPKKADSAYAPDFIWRRFRAVWRAAFLDKADGRAPRSTTSDITSPGRTSTSGRARGRTRTPCCPTSCATWGTPMSGTPSTTSASCPISTRTSPRWPRRLM